MTSEDRKRQDRELRELLAGVLRQLSGFNTALPAIGITGIVVTWIGLDAYLSSHGARWVWGQMALSGDLRNLTIMGALILSAVFLFYAIPGILLHASAAILKHGDRIRIGRFTVRDDWYNTASLIIMGIPPAVSAWMKDPHTSLLMGTIVLLSFLHAVGKFPATKWEASHFDRAMQVFYGILLSMMAFATYVLVVLSTLIASLRYLPPAVTASAGWVLFVYACAALLFCLLYGFSVGLGRFGFGVVLFAVVFLLLAVLPQGTLMQRVLGAWESGGYKARILRCYSERCQNALRDSCGEVFVLLTADGMVYMQNEDSKKRYAIPAADIEAPPPETAAPAGPSVSAPETVSAIPRPAGCLAPKAGR